ncbi:MAG: Gfo/Idh/MocA family oxidoreductase [Paracoccaceae bacterium]
MTAPIPLVVLGAGRAALAEARRIEAAPEVRLLAMVEPAEEARLRAADAGLPVAADLDDLPGPPDGAVVAGPFPRQGADVEACAAQGWPTMLIRPLGVSLRDARRAAAAAEAAGVPLLVGHHRRHLAVVGAAREALAGGLLGRLVAVQSLWALRAPAARGRWAWRVESGAAAALVQLVHEVDLLRFLAGDVAEISADVAHHEARGAKEDTVALSLRFASGALGSALLTDAGLSPWGWEAGTGESDAIHPTGEDALRLVGAEGALSLPSLAYWRYAGDGRGDSGKPLDRLPMPCPSTDPGAAQLSHFVAVVRDGATPLAPAAEGLASLAAAMAALASARDGIRLAPDPDRIGPWEAATEALAGLRVGRGSGTKEGRSA